MYEALKYLVPLVILLLVGLAYLLFRLNAARELVTQATAQCLQLRVALQDSEVFKNVILNSVDAEIAVLNQQGSILAVNDAWQRFALELENRSASDAGQPLAVPGANYLAVCDAVQSPQSPQAGLASQGIRSVLSGQAPSFSLEYACHSPSRMRWYRMAVLPLRLGTHPGVVITHTDITDRVQSEQEKVLAQSHLQTIASHVPGLVFQYRLRVDGSSCFPYASDAIHDVFQLSPQEVLDDASKVFAHVHPDDRARVLASIQKSAQKLSPWQLEFRVRYEDASVRWLFGNAMPERDADGSTLWHGFMTDITQRRQSEVELRKLSIAVEHSPASVVITDAYANIEYVNPQFTKVSGYSAAEAIGQNPRILQSRLTQKETYHKLWKTLASGQTWHGELVNKRKNGELYWEESHIAPVKNAGGEISHYVAIKADVTDRIHSAQKIDSLLREQRAILNSDLVGIATVRERCIVWANTGFENMLGYGPGELVGMATRQIFLNEQDYVFFDSEAYPVLRAGKVFRTNVEFQRKNGSSIWVDVSGDTLNQNAGDSLWCFNDITQRKLAESRLIQSEAQIKGVLEGAADAIFIANRQAQLLYANGQASLMLGYSRDEFLRMTVNDLLAGECRLEVLPQLDQLVSSGSLRSEFRLKRKNGQTIPVDFNGTVLPDGSLFGSCRDISERKETEKLLQESEAYLQAIIENEPECIKIVNAQGLLVQMNPAGLQMIEAESFAQVRNTPVLDLIAPEDRDAVADMHSRVIAGETVLMEFVVLGLKGGRRCLETHAVPMRVQGETMHLAVTRDITQRKQMEDKVRQMAFHDPLTNLPNRRLLLDRLSQAIASSKRSGSYLALMFLDLDNFKPLNDAHGHGVGDLLLIEVARRLADCVRQVDSVARLGGDEFVAMLGELHIDRATSVAQALAVAEKIRNTLSQPYCLSISADGQTVVEHHCSVSIGLVVFAHQESNMDEILKHADMAMYQAKDAGRNAICLYEQQVPA